VVLSPPRGRIVCAGNAALDRTFALSGPARLATSNPAQLRTGYGGVARNVAENLARLGVSVSLVSQVGDDAGGRALRDDCAAHRIDVRWLALSPAHVTSEYVAVIDPQRELVIGASASAAIDALSAAEVRSAIASGGAAAWIFADCNLPPSVLAALIEDRRNGGPRLAIDAVSTVKALRLPQDLRGLDLLFANEDEARALGTRGAEANVITRGARGVVVATRSRTAELDAPPARAVDVTGAGDALVAGTLYGLLGGETLIDAVRTGTLAALMTIESATPVARSLTPAALDGLRARFAVPT
jgi:pseudouridine kinase